MSFPFLFYSIISHLFMYFACISLPLSYFNKARYGLANSMQHKVTGAQIQCAADGSRKSHYIICSSIWHGHRECVRTVAAPVTNNIFHTIWFGATFSTTGNVFWAKELPGSLSQTRRHQR